MGGKSPVVSQSQGLNKVNDDRTRMATTDTISVLNRVLVILRSSFPQYLQYSRPYIPQGRENVLETVEEIVAAQTSLIARISEQVFESGGLPDKGEFPVEFTDTHDLGIDYQIRAAISYQKQDIAELADCVDALRLAPAAQALAAEALGMAKGHLQSLEELSSEPSKSTVVGAKAFDN
jgi:hypothetical protein